MGFCCSVCRDDDGAASTSSLACGHTFCDSERSTFPSLLHLSRLRVFLRPLSSLARSPLFLSLSLYLSSSSSPSPLDCWGNYLGSKVSSGETRITCMEPKCPLQVSGDVVNKLAPRDVAAKFGAFFLNSIVDDAGGGSVWCPTPGCGLAADRPRLPAAPAPGGEVNPYYLVATCAKGHSFCSCCSHEAHAPASCDMVKAWLKKCADDSETYNWISAHTKDCPNCKSTIEKNGGCNHMTCKKCKGEFCW